MALPSGSPTNSKETAVTGNNDQCQYKRCRHPLGPWLPTKNVDGFGEAEERCCEKCGGKQWRARIKDGEFLDTVEGLFKGDRRE